MQPSSPSTPSDRHGCGATAGVETREGGDLRTVEWHPP